MSQNLPSGQSLEQPTNSDESAKRQTTRSSGGAWIGGVVLILLGVMFLLQNTNLVNLSNWWALFILIPAIGVFGNAWSQYRSRGTLTASILTSIGIGVVITLVAVGFLFNLSMSIIFPVALILIGIGALGTVLLK